MGKLLKIIISVAIILTGLAEQYPTMASGESYPSNIMNVKQLDQTRETTVADIGGHWAKKEIVVWIEKGLARGYEDGTFRPEDSVTRAEFIAFVNRMYGYTEQSTINFSIVLIGIQVHAEHGLLRSDHCRNAVHRLLHVVSSIGRGFAVHCRLHNNCAGGGIVVPTTL